VWKRCLDKRVVCWHHAKIFESEQNLHYSIMITDLLIEFSLVTFSTFSNCYKVLVTPKHTNANSELLMSPDAKPKHGAKSFFTMSKTKS